MDLDLGWMGVCMTTLAAAAVLITSADRRSGDRLDRLEEGSSAVIIPLMRMHANDSKWRRRPHRSISLASRGNVETVSLEGTFGKEEGREEEEGTD